MIVTCEQCSTRFQLDEARIPPNGARLRCSRCKHTFFLPSPVGGSSDPMHSIAERSAQDPTTRVPDPAEDLEAAIAAEPEPDLEEEDWEFSEEVRVEGDDLDDDLGVVLGDGPDASTPSEQIDTDAGAIPTAATADSRLDLEGPRQWAAPARDESRFGSIDDFSSLLVDDGSPVRSDVIADLANEIASELDSEPPVATSTARGRTEDLGDPESWNLVESGDFGGTSPGFDRTTPLGSGASIDSVEAEDFFSGEGFDEAGDDLELASSSLANRAVGLVARAVGWGVALASIAAVVLLVLQAERVRWAQVPQIVSIGGVVAETASASWVETSRSGAVLRFEGQVRNTAGRAVWPGAVQLTLLDARGERLLAEPIVAGLPLLDLALRESDLGALVEHVVAATGRFGATPLAPGEVRPFEVLIPEERLPEAASRVLLEMGEPRLVVQLTRDRRSRTSDEAVSMRVPAPSDPVVR